ncbi:MAG: hypothetical protein V2B20_10505, partial [Pseudomonadota bacterium]
MTSVIVLNYLKKSKNVSFLIAIVLILQFSTAEGAGLLFAIDQALSQSDTAYDLRDTLELSKMATASAEH